MPQRAPLTADAFPHQTQACSRSVPRQWHQGIERAFCWGFLIDFDPSPIQDALCGVLWPDYRRQPHVTVSYCGLSGVEFDAESRRRDVALLTKVCHGPIELRPTRWASFPTCPMLEVSADWLDSAHKLLAAREPRRRVLSYRPHLTLGLYRVSRPGEAIATVMRHFELPDSWQVSRLQLLSYATKEPDGELQVEGELNLTTACYTS